MPTISASPARLIVAAGRAHGVDFADLFDAAGIDPAVLADPDGRLPHPLLVTLWNELVRRTKDEAAGIHAALGMARGAYGALDYVADNAATLGDCYRTVLRYQRLLHDGADFRLTVDGTEARLVHVFPPGLGSPPPPLGDFLAANFLVRGRRVLREDWAPREVHLPRPPPADRRAFEAFFRAELFFDAPNTELVFDAELLARPLPGADPNLALVLDRHVRELLSRLAAPDDFLDRVRREVCASLRQGVPRAADVARRLGLSERSLFRRLQQEGTTYQDVVDFVRRELAMRQLGDPALALSEVAFLLGYSEASAFHRAFRRWTGESPGEYRRRVSAVPESRARG